MAVALLHQRGQIKRPAIVPLQGDWGPVPSLSDLSHHRLAHLGTGLEGVAGAVLPGRSPVDATGNEEGWAVAP